MSRTQGVHATKPLDYGFPDDIAQTRTQRLSYDPSYEMVRRQEDVWHDASESVLSLLEAPEWHAKAACRGMGPDAFFPERGEDTSFAKAVCERCPVRAECLEGAIARNERFGVWGGVSERGRRGMRSKSYDADEMERAWCVVCGTGFDRWLGAAVKAVYCGQRCRQKASRDRLREAS